MPQVWYVSYGSNMSEERLACYLQGGVPPGGLRANPGARDATPPSRAVAVDLPGTTYFAGDSPQWGGGVAFYDHETPGFTAGRAYLLTLPQLVDVAAQEMHRVPCDDDPLERLLLEPLPDGRHRMGAGVYETLVEVGRRRGVAMLTLTAPHGCEEVEQVAPSPAYLATLATGLLESRRLEPGAGGGVPRLAGDRRARSGPGGVAVGPGLPAHPAHH